MIFYFPNIYITLIKKVFIKIMIIKIEKGADKLNDSKLPEENKNPGKKDLRALVNARLK